MFELGIGIAIIGEGLRGFPNLGLVGSITIVVGGIIVLLGALNIG